MNPTSALAIYIIFWFFCLFLVLPFHARKAGDIDEIRVAGQAESAPVRFRPGKAAVQTTLLAAALFGGYYLNYVNGWVTRADISFLQPPPGIEPPR